MMVKILYIHPEKRRTRLQRREVQDLQGVRVLEERETVIITIPHLHLLQNLPVVVKNNTSRENDAAVVPILIPILLRHHHRKNQKKISWTSHSGQNPV